MIKLIQIKITETQLDVLRAALGELGYALKFDDYKGIINATRKDIISLFYDIVNIKN